MIDLDSPLTTVLGDASTKAKREKRRLIEEKLGLRTVGDLVHHFPRRYLAMGELTDVEELTEGDQLTVVGRIVDRRRREYQDRRTKRTAYRVEAVLQTGGPRLQMTFFAQKPWIAEWQEKRVAVGREGVFLGRVGRFHGQWQLTNPQLVMFGHDDTGEAMDRAALEGLRGLFPLYPTTARVDSWDLQRAIGFALTVLDELPEPVPEEVRRRHDLLDGRTALQWIHAPADHDEVRAARRYFRFTEALVTQLVLARRRAEQRVVGARARAGTTPSGERGNLLAAFDARLPFELTTGQREIGEQLFTDLADCHPMNRLLQGEVGSGKTLVALRAMLRVIDSGGQAALLAPTEVLAQQHHRSITAMLGDLAAGGMLGGAEEATGVALLTGSMGRARRAEELLGIASGEAGIVIGTHALLQQQVSFADLGLVVVDEQHRFGVEQRAALTDKAGTAPHVLVMTATPIPRTVAMTVFGDLETSVLRELPAGREPVQTTLVPLATQPHWIDRVWARVREEVAAGHQVYVVCPRIGGDEAEQGQQDAVDRDPEGVVVEPAASEELSGVEEVAPELAEGPLAGLRVAQLHGRLAGEEKESVMRRFADGEIDVLVSTTVIEVGVDVVNATAMVLLDADRFGISQLHQLRGRVGRGGLPGLCLLVTRADPDGPAAERLAAVAATNDGFELARLDLERRREGDVLGSSQSGFRSGLQNLRVLRDEPTIVAARTEAEQLVTEDPALTSLPALQQAVRVLEDDGRADFLEKS